MPGSNKPRPAHPLRPRTGRPPDSARFVLEQPTVSDLVPGSSFSVEGRADVGFWSDPRRADFRRLGELAASFGLQVVETNLAGIGDRPRRVWDHKRVDLDHVLAMIKDIPGILFDDWLKIYLAGVPETPPSLAAARKKAQVALHRLYHDGKVDKRYADDGRLILYPFGKAPADAKTRPGSAPKEF